MEYEVINVSPMTGLGLGNVTDIREIENQTKRMGRKGWRLVNSLINPETCDVILFFEKEIQDNE